MLTTQNLILLDCENLSKNEIIETLSKKLVEEGFISDYSKYLESVYHREEIAPTTVGYNVGLPHGKGSMVKESVVAVMRVKNPVLWNIQENENVKLIFMLAIADREGNNIHSDILVELSKKILDKNFRDRILKTNKVEEVLKLMSE